MGSLPYWIGISGPRFHPGRHPQERQEPIKLVRSEEARQPAGAAERNACPAPRIDLEQALRRHPVAEAPEGGGATS